MNITQAVLSYRADTICDRQTDAWGKTICLPTLKGGDIKSQQQQNHHLRMDSSLSPQGALMRFTGTIESAAVEVQEKFSSYGGLLTNAMYYHGETL